LPDFINITSIQDKENMLFIFDSITWDLSMKTSNSGNLTSFTSTWLVELHFWFKWALTWPLTKTVKYNTKTFITDY
jgi:hypothetical protein